MSMKCIGKHFASGEPVEISFDSAITGVDPLLSSDTLGGMFLAPGFIDLQVNGFAGVDYNSPSAAREEIERSIQRQFATGVTRLFPTVITGAPDDMLAAFRNLAAAKESIPSGAAMEGFHLEGPYISPEDGPRGAHPARWIRPPSLDEFHRFQEASRGNIRLITLAPELPDSPSFIEALVRQGVVVSIGHTAANAGQIAAAVSAGATLSTHLGNGTHSSLPKTSNYIWDQLAEDRLAASFIADGVHLPVPYLKVALRAKGLDRSLLVTDAAMPADCEPGFYRLGEVDVELRADHSVRLRGGSRLAGSALRMDRAIENVMRFAGLSLTEAVTLATRNPARLGRINARQRGLNPGDRADLVQFRYDAAGGKIEILATYLSGQRVYMLSSPPHSAPRCT